MLNAPVDNEDLVLKMLASLNDDYKDICSAMRVYETPITFDELHEKLINHEAYLKTEVQKKHLLTNMPAFANPAHKTHFKHSNNHYQPSPTQNQPPIFLPNTHALHQIKPKHPNLILENANFVALKVIL